MWESGVITADAFFCADGSDWLPVLSLFEPVQFEAAKADIHQDIKEPVHSVSEEAVANNGDASDLQIRILAPAYAFQRLIALLIDSGIVALCVAGGFELLERMGIRSDNILTTSGFVIIIVVFSARDVLGLGRFISRSDIVDEKTGDGIDCRRRLLRGVTQLLVLPAPMYLAVAVGWILQFILGERIAAVFASACAAGGSVGIAYLICQMASAKGQAAWDHAVHSVVVRSRKHRAKRP